MKDNCKLWQGAKTPKGYGVLTVSGKQIFAHRLAYRLFHGVIPAGMLVCHKCDTPDCINPDHLFLGTAKDNTQDMSIKGRGLYGRSPVEIMNIHTSEKIVFQTQKEAGKFIGVTQAAISHAIRKDKIISEKYKPSWYNQNKQS